MSGVPELSTQLYWDWAEHRSMFGADNLAKENRRFARTVFKILVPPILVLSLPAEFVGRALPKHPQP